MTETSFNYKSWQFGSALFFCVYD